METSPIGLKDVIIGAELEPVATTGYEAEPRRIVTLSGRALALALAGAVSFLAAASVTVKVIREDLGRSVEARTLLDQRYSKYLKTHGYTKAVPTAVRQ